MPVSYSPELDHGNDVPTGPPFMLQEVVFEFEFSNFVRIILWFRRLYIRDSYYTNGFQPAPPDRNGIFVQDTTTEFAYQMRIVLICRLMEMLIFRLHVSSK